MTTLLLAELSGNALAPATGKALSAAKDLGGDVHILVGGADVEGAARSAAKLQGVSKVLVADAPHLANGLAEEVAALILSLAKSYSAIVAPATAFGKNVLPRVAAKLDVMQISDIIKVVSPDTFERPIYAGNAIQTVQSPEAVKVITVRTSAFPSAPESGSAAIESVTAPADVGSTTFEKAELTKSDRPELTSARIIISGGRGMGNGENFAKYIEPVADRLGAAMGASRAAVDAGFVPNDWQVGQTGKVVAPDLYIAVGISGAIQHLAGMKDSKIIVAINKDGEAPIFQVADYGLVADLFQALPELDAELQKAGR
jgi:electron transfer flavoprotein alpha subunit